MAITPPTTTDPATGAADAIRSAAGPAVSSRSSIVPDTGPAVGTMARAWRLNHASGWIAVGVASALAGLGLKWLFLRVGIEVVYMPLLVGVSAAAWRGGAAPGMLATLLSAFVDLWLFEPSDVFRPTWSPDAGFAAYILVGGAISWLAEVRLRALRAAEASREEAVRLRDQQRAVLQSIDGPVLVVAPDGRITLANRAATALLGPVGHLDDLRDRLRPVEAEGIDLVPGSTREARLDGSDRVLRLAVSGVDDRVGGTRVVAMRDVTELRRAEEAREVFIGILSHELRTPVTTIMGGVDLLGRDLPEAHRQAVLADVTDEAERLRRLVEDVLVLSRFERHAIEVEDEPVLVRRIVASTAAQEARRTMPPADVRVELAPDLPPVRADETYLEQILRNVIGNAVKYGGEDGPVTVSAARQGEHVEVVVSDVGPGFPASDAERLFELFYRSRRTSSKPGAGIGLFVARQLARSMGGDLTARPRPGRGAEFLLSLQAFASPDEATAQP